MMDNMVTFENCRGSQAVIDRHLKLGRAVKKGIEVMEK